MAKIKITDIALKNGIKVSELTEFIRKSEEYSPHIEWSFSTMIMEDYLMESAVRDFKKAYMPEEFENVQREEREIAEIANILITSGFNFDGYKIVKYSGYISGDDAIQVDRGFTIFGSGSVNTAAALMASLVEIRKNALKELKQAAYDLGCNAVIGVDFDYLTLEPETASLTGHYTTYLPYVFGVTANGNAVIIEKDE